MIRDRLRNIRRAEGRRTSGGKPALLLALLALPSFLPGCALQESPLVSGTLGLLGFERPDSGQDQRKQRAPRPVSADIVFPAAARGHITLHPGSTVREEQGTDSFMAEYRRDGSAILRKAASPGISHGRWWVGLGGELCQAYPDIAGGGILCGPLYPGTADKAGWHWSVETGLVSFSFDTVQRL